jgi:Domain of unknown function (DUF4214)
MATITSVVDGVPTIALGVGETYTFGTGADNVFIYQGETFPSITGNFILPGDDTLTLDVPGPATITSDGQNTIDLGTGAFDTVDAGPDDTITSGSGYPTINAADGDTITTGAGGGLINVAGGVISIDEVNLFAPLTIALPDVIAQADLSGTSQLQGGSGFALTAPGLQVNFGSEGQMNFLDGSINDPADAAINAYYELALGRPADLIGLSYSLAVVQAQGFPPGTLSPQDSLLLADKTDFFQGIVDSAEFQAKYGSLSNSAFVDTLYQNSNTSEDAAGAAFWTGRLDAGASKAAVLNGFANDAISPFTPQQTSNEYVPNAAAISVTSLYETVLGRAPDPTGYANAIMAENAGLTPQELAQSLIGSQEFASAGSSGSNSDFVSHIQQAAYGSVDPAATAFWAQALDTGAVSRGGVAMAYAQSDVMTDKVAAVLGGGKLTGT